MEAHPAAHRPGARTLTPRFVLRRASDQRLVQLVHDGHVAAFEVLYERLTPALLSYCRQLLGSQADAEDAVQHALLAAHRKIEADPDIQLRPWLYTVARNRSVSILRARREEPLDEAPEPSVAGLSEAVQTNEELREVLRDVGRLPEDQRSALVLSELGDLSHREIAEVVGCEEPKVKSLVFQARSSLMAARQARDTDCSTIREQLGTLTGGALRRRELREHLRTCPGCREYRDEVRRQRAALAIVLPVVPTVALRDAVLGSIGASGGIGGAAVLGGGAAAGAGSALGAKAAAVVAATAVAGGIGLAVGTSQERDARPDAVEAARERGRPAGGALGLAGAAAVEAGHKRQNVEGGRGNPGVGEKNNGRGDQGKRHRSGPGSGRDNRSNAAPAAPVATGPPEGAPPATSAAGGNGGQSSGPSRGEIRSYEVSKGANGAAQSGNANAGGGNANAGGGNPKAGGAGANGSGSSNAGGGNANASGGNPRSQKPDSPPGGGKPDKE